MYNKTQQIFPTINPTLHNAKEYFSRIANDETLETRRIFMLSSSLAMIDNEQQQRIATCKTRECVSRRRTRSTIIEIRSLKRIADTRLKENCKYVDHGTKILAQSFRSLHTKLVSTNFEEYRSSNFHFYRQLYDQLISYQRRISICCNNNVRNDFLKEIYIYRINRGANSRHLYAVETDETKILQIYSHNIRIISKQFHQITLFSEYFIQITQGIVRISTMLVFQPQYELNQNNVPSINCQ